MLIKNAVHTLFKYVHHSVGVVYIGVSEWCIFCFINSIWLGTYRIIFGLPSSYFNNYQQLIWPAANIWHFNLQKYQSARGCCVFCLPLTANKRGELTDFHIFHIHETQKKHQELNMYNIGKHAVLVTERRQTPWKELYSLVKVCPNIFPPA